MNRKLKDPIAAAFNAALENDRIRKQAPPCACPDSTECNPACNHCEDRLEAQQPDISDIRLLLRMPLPPPVILAAIIELVEPGAMLDAKYGHE